MVQTATLCLWYCSAFAWSQPPAPQPAPASPTTAAAPPAGDASKPAFKQEELDQMLAPIALYPDDLLSQVLMASTYPIEVVSADRWTKAHKDLKGEALTKELEKQDWDPSVKSLVNFPDVLAGLSENLDLTVKIGDAFIADQKKVMDTVQALRAKAKEAGNLQSSKEITVKVEQEPTTKTEVIYIQPANPQVIYVPTYNPTIVYGTWAYPAYPPPPPIYYPPGYVATAAFSFAAGVAVGAAWGYAWGHCNWGHGDVNIDINRNTNINNSINRNNYQNNFNKNGGANGQWQHNADHRKGASYRDGATANKFGGGANTQAAQSREAARGRTTAGQQPGGAGAGAGNRGAGEPANRAGNAGVSGAGTGGAKPRPSTGGAAPAKSNALQGASGSGSGARASSSRGGASRGRGGGGGRR
jgi:hypothetical protein